MERRKFLQTGLLASVLAALFPRLIQSEIGPEGSLSPTSSTLSKDSQDLRMYPMTPDEAYVKVLLTDIHSPMEAKISRVGMTGFVHENCSGGGLMDTSTRDALEMHINGGIVEKARGFIIKYRYENSDLYVNLHVPASRFLKKGGFSWPAAKPVLNSVETVSLMYVLKLGDCFMDVMESPMFEGENNFVVERWDDHIDIHLS